MSVNVWSLKWNNVGWDLKSRMCQCTVGAESAILVFFFQSRRHVMFESLLFFGPQ
jgi:hypothetical protein